MTILQQQALVARVRDERMDGEVAMFLLGACCVLTTGRHAQTYGLVALRTSYAALPHVDGAGREERRFNRDYLNEHSRDRKWGGEAQLRALARHFEVDVVVIDREEPDSKVLLFECHSNRLRRSKDWEVDIVPRLARQRSSDWPRTDEVKYPLVVLHWVMGRTHYEPALYM